MATLVFGTRSGPLIQTQVGTADIVATFHAAHAAWGWLGGLQSIHSLLRVIPNKFIGQSTKLFNLGSESELRLLPTCAYVLSSTGPQEIFIDDASQSFGNDIRTQIIGLTICALAHELRAPAATILFQRCLMRQLFEASGELLDAMDTQLSDNDVRQRIINEGASRGLSKLFNDAVKALNLPPGDCAGVKAEIKKTWQEHMDYEPSELHMVGGLLKWISQPTTTPYFTRSGLVARTAVYLKTVGYLIGVVECWNGVGEPPSALGPNAIVLVLGGTSSTDEFMVDPEEIESHGPNLMFHHYNSRTVGSLLHNALGHPADISPETLQDDFEYVKDYIESHASAEWTSISAPWTSVTGFETFILTIGCKWHGAPQSSSLERSLAGIYFPLSGEQIAPCYRRMATEQSCRIVRDSAQRRVDATSNLMQVEVARFRGITAAIYIALATRLAQEGEFQRSGHSTTLQLINEDWLDRGCHNIDRFSSESIHTHVAVHILATIHAGGSPDRINQSIRSGTIGYREGSYSVLPAVFLHFEPTHTALNFVLSDCFFANISANSNGEIKDIAAPRLLNESADPNIANHNDTLALATLREPWAGPPCRASPDCPLYLSLERHADGNMGLVGRVNGSSIGKASITDVLYTVFRSLQQPNDCPHQEDLADVQNVTASRWALKSRIYKPAGFRNRITYVPVADDNAWALFLAGESRNHNGVIVHRCTLCAALCYDGSKDRVQVLIGYK
ncbi:hypothetical protein CUC08_Gglean007506 [Alternaria sp. MG1]|nr:hypothetical protein CUC08_Gglean007506 [Alternaria sp. MG1]